MWVYILSNFGNSGITSLVTVHRASAGDDLKVE